MIDPSHAGGERVIRYQHFLEFLKRAVVFFESQVKGNLWVLQPWNDIRLGV